MSFAYVLLAFNLLATRQVPPGTQLHIRLLTTIGSYASRAGDPVTAVLIAPVVSNGQIVLPEGSLLSGTLKSVQRVGFGIVHENAALDLQFLSISLPGGETFPLSSRVQEVDNGRERVTRGGSIRGVRTTTSLSYRTSGYVRTALQWEVHAAVAVWAIKTLLVQVPEPELYYPAGVELTLRLSEPIGMRAPAQPAVTAGLLTGEERPRMAALVEELPARTHTSETNRPSDLINVMFIGSRDQLANAFATAGWTEPREATMRANIRRIRAVAEGHGDNTAPMSELLLQDAPADMSWQKGFNDISKRHHIRIWKQSVTWDDREIWIGAATRDVDFAYLRPGRAMTHKIDENIDDERDKVVNDLVFTSCASLVDAPARLDVPVSTRNATGDPMKTDTRLAVVRLNGCETPPDGPQIGWAQASLTHMDSAQPAQTPLPLHGNKLRRFARREILCFRSDLLRENVYWRSYEGIRWTITAVRDHRRQARTGGDTTLQASTYVPMPVNRRTNMVLDLLGR
jgi:hypothetical protein